MTLNKRETGRPIRGRVQPNRAEFVFCVEVIAKLQFADLSRQKGTLYKNKVARLDIQDPPPEAVNLQVQIGSTSVAAVLVSNTVLSAKNLENQHGVANAVISALNQSLDTGTVWEVSGTLS